MCTVKLSMRFARVSLHKVSFLQTVMRTIHFEACDWPWKKGRYFVQDEADPDKLELVEEFYRKMKEKYKAEGNQGEASQWHLAEKEARRKRLKLTFPTAFEWLVHNLYWLSSGYAEMPFRALMAFLVFCAVLVGSLWLFGGACLNSAIFAAVQHVLFVKDPAFPLMSSPKTFLFVTLLSKLFIPLQAAFFALALRNKFRR